MTTDDFLKFCEDNVETENAYKMVDNEQNYADSSERSDKNPPEQQHKEVITKKVDKNEKTNSRHPTMKVAPKRSTRKKYQKN